MDNFQDGIEAEIKKLVDELRNLKDLTDYGLGCWYRGKMLAKAYAAIGRKNGRNGVILCPICSNNLTWQRYDNGHVHGQCATPGCLNWME
jgi:hypothetical protein